MSRFSLGNVILLLWISRRFEDRLKPGDLFLVYLIIYPLGRFLLDFLRLDASMIAGINFNQTLMAIIVVAASTMLFWRHRREKA